MRASQSSGIRVARSERFRSLEPIKVILTIKERAECLNTRHFPSKTLCSWSGSHATQETCHCLSGLSHTTAAFCNQNKELCGENVNRLHPLIDL